MKRLLRLGCMACAIAFATACGGNENEVPTPEGGTSSPDAGVCSFAPKGSAFTFHLHNSTTSAVALWLGCGKSVPIVLDTPDGKLSAGPGVDVCEFTCEDIFTNGVSPGGCTDCGGGESEMISPNETFDLAWDRRAYGEETADPRCSGKPGTCALAHGVAPTSAQAGVLTSCQDPGLLGACQQPKMTSFAVDTTGSEALIEIK